MSLALLWTSERNRVYEEENGDKRDADNGVDDAQNGIENWSERRRDVGEANGGEEKAAKKTTFDLKLEGGFDAGSKIKIIKEVRTFTDLGLKEAKELGEKAPILLKKGVLEEEARKIIEKMKGIGAKVVME